MAIIKLIWKLLKIYAVKLISLFLKLLKARLKAMLLKYLVMGAMIAMAFVVAYLVLK